MGKVKVSNGKETYEIDGADLPSAVKEGFKPTDRIIVANSKTNESYEVGPDDVASALKDGYNFSDIVKKKAGGSPTESKSPLQGGSIDFTKPVQQPQAKEAAPVNSNIASTIQEATQHPEQLKSTQEVFQHATQFAKFRLQQELAGNKDIIPKVIANQKAQNQYQSAGIPNSDQPQTGAAQAAAALQQPQDPAVSQDEIDNYTNSINQDPNAQRGFLHDVMKAKPEKAPQIQQNLYLSDRSEAPYHGENNQSKVLQNANKIGSGELQYLPGGALVKPENAIESISTGVNNKFQTLHDYDFINNSTPQERIKWMEDKTKNFDPDEPIPMPQGVLAQATYGIASQPFLGALIGKGAGIATGAIPGAEEFAPVVDKAVSAFLTGNDFRKLATAQAYQKVYSELRQAHPDMPLEQVDDLADRQSKDEGLAEGIAGSAMMLVGGQIGEVKLPKLSLQDGYKAATITAFKNIGKTGAEAGTVGLIGGFAKDFENNLAKEKGIFRSGNGEDIKDAVLQGGLFTAGIIALSKGSHLVGDITKQKILQGLSKSNENTVDQIIGEQLVNGNITPEQAHNVTNAINEHRVLDQAIPGNVAEDSRLTIQRRIKKRVALEDELETADKAYHPDIKEKIKGINDEILDLSKDKVPRSTIPETDQKSPTNQTDASKTEAETQTEGGLLNAQADAEQKPVTAAEPAPSSPETDKKVLEQAVSNKEIKGAQNDVAEMVLSKNDPEKVTQFYKEVADQALNKVAPDASPSDSESYKQAVNDYGQNIVDHATKLFPLKTVGKEEAAPSLQDFTEHVNQMVKTVKAGDRGTNWIMDIQGMTQADREGAISDIEAGKDSKRAEKYNTAIQAMHDKGAVALARGFGNHAESVDIPFKDYFGLDDTERHAAFNLDDHTTSIINSNDVTLNNIDDLKHLFNGFPYNEDDFNNVKAYLEGQGKSHAAIEETGTGREAGKKIIPESTPAQEKITTHEDFEKELRKIFPEKETTEKGGTQTGTGKETEARSSVALPKIGDTSKEVTRPEGEDLKQYQKPTDVLDKASKHFEGDEQISKTIDFLRPIMEAHPEIHVDTEAEVPHNVLGFSHPDGKVELNFDRLKNYDDLYRTALHEFMHSATRSEIETNSAFKDTLSDALSDIRDALKVPDNGSVISALVDKGVIDKDKYGAANEHELVAEVFSNKKFADYLSNIQYKGDSLLKKVIEHVVSYFNKKYAALKEVKGNISANNMADFITQLVQGTVKGKGESEGEALPMKDSEKGQALRDIVKRGIDLPHEKLKESLKNIAGLSDKEAEQLINDVRGTPTEDTYGLPFYDEPGDKKTGIKNALSNKERFERALPKVDVPKLGTDNERLLKGKELVDSGKINPRELVNDINETGRGMQPDESKAMVYYMHQLAVHEDNLRQLHADAETETEKANISGQLQQLSDEVDSATEANIKAGTPWAEVGLDRQVVVDMGFNPSREKSFIKDGYGGHIPKDVQDRLDVITKERDKALEHVNKLKSDQSKAAASDTIKKAKPEKSVKKSKEDFTKERTDIKKSISDKLKKGRTGESGLTAVPLPFAKELIAIAPDVFKLVKSYAEEGILKLEDVVGRLHDELKDEINGISKKNIIDLLAGKYNEKKETKDTIAQRVSDIKAEAKLISKLADARKGEENTPKQRQEKTGRVKDLQNKISEVRKKNNKWDFDKRPPIESLLEPAAPKEPKSPIEKEVDRLNTKADNLQKKIDAGDFATKQQEKPKFEKTTDLVKAQQRVVNAEYKIKQEKRKAFESQKNMYQKGLMWAGRAFRISILSGVNVLEKLAAAATIGGGVKRIPEQVAGKMWQHVFTGIAKKAPIEGNPNVMAEMKFYKDFFNPKKFAQNSWQILKTGASDLSKKHGGGEYEHIPVLYLPTDLHQIIKDPLKRGTYEASLHNVMNWSAKQGLDINDPLVIQSMETAAYKRSQYEIFQEQNSLTKKFSEWKSSMEKRGNRGATAKFLADFMIPVSTVPTNIARRVLTTSPLGMIRGAVKVTDAYRKGIENLSNDEADAVMKQLKQGTLGTALWLTGWFGYKSFGGLYSQFNPNKKRSSDELPSDQMMVNGEMIDKPVQHALPLEIIQLSATMRHIYDHYVDKGSDSFTSSLMAAVGSIGAIAEQIPVLETPAHIIGATQDPYEAKKLGEDVKRRFEPQILRETGVIGDNKKDQSNKPTTKIKEWTP